MITLCTGSKELLWKSVNKIGPNEEEVKIKNILLLGWRLTEKNYQRKFFRQFIQRASLDNVPSKFQQLVKQHSHYTLYSDYVALLIVEASSIYFNNEIWASVEKVKITLRIFSKQRCQS